MGEFGVDDAHRSEFSWMILVCLKGDNEDEDERDRDEDGEQDGDGGCKSTWTHHGSTW